MNINILEWLEAAAERSPSQTAFADLDKQIDYCSLLQRAKRIGCKIIARSGQRGEVWHNRPIAVLIDRNIESLILFMGIVYSGNFYVPLDDTMPRKRIDLILDTLEPVLILNSKSATSLSSESIDLISYAELVGTEEMREEEEALREVRKRHLDTDPLYTIFTSGSTGVPKGVVVNHRSVIDLVMQFADTFAFPSAPVFGNQAPLDFDVSTKDIYCSLYLGGTVQVVPKQYFVLPVKLIPYLNERGVNVIIWAVSALRIVSNFKVFENFMPESLSLIMFSGEVMPVKDLNYWRRALPDAQFVNLYGPTEITCNCGYYIIDREFEETEALPVGQAFHNTEMFLIDTQTGGLITRKGQKGEIYVRGTCLAMGYYNNPEKTRAAFVQNPQQSVYPELVYRTGDLGFYGERDELYFAGRKDYQIKHMGHRIELGEIETAVNALDFIDVGCCIYDEGKEKIILCYQAKEACDRRIVKALGDFLPKFMWPNQYIFFEKIPMNKNGKIDRALLKKEYCG